MEPFHFAGQLLIFEYIIYIHPRGGEIQCWGRGGGKFIYPQLPSLSFVPPPQNQCFVNPSSLPQFRRDGALSPEHTISCIWRYNIHSSKGRMKYSWWGEGNILPPQLASLFQLIINYLSPLPNPNNVIPTPPFVLLANQFLVFGDIIYILQVEEGVSPGGESKVSSSPTYKLWSIPPPQNQCFVNPSSLPQFVADGALYPCHPISCVWRYNIHSSKWK